MMMMMMLWPLLTTLKDHPPQEGFKTLSFKIISPKLFEEEKKWLGAVETCFIKKKTSARRNFFSYL